jgi:hypothetical protein
MAEDTYSVVRYYDKMSISPEVVRTGLSLQEATQYCFSDQGMSKPGVKPGWFCAHKKEKKA